MEEMSKQSFKELSNILRPSLQGNVTRMRQFFSVETQVAALSIVSTIHIFLSKIRLQKQKIHV